MTEPSPFSISFGGLGEQGSHLGNHGVRAHPEPPLPRASRQNREGGREGGKGGQGRVAEAPFDLIWKAGRWASRWGLGSLWADSLQLQAAGCRPLLSKS